MAAFAFATRRFSTPPQHRMPPTASFLKWSGRQAVRGSEALRSVLRMCPCGVFTVVCVGCAGILSLAFCPVACASVLRLSVAVGSSLCFLSLPSAPLQHTSAAPHAADHFSLKRSGGQPEGYVHLHTTIADTSDREAHLSQHQTTGKRILADTRRQGSAS